MKESEIAEIRIEYDPEGWYASYLCVRNDRRGRRRAVPSHVNMMGKPVSLETAVTSVLRFVQKLEKD